MFCLYVYLTFLLSNLIAFGHVNRHMLYLYKMYCVNFVIVFFCTIEILYKLQKFFVLNCLSNTLKVKVMVRLLKCVCYRLYGCELWDLDGCSLDRFFAAWRKGVRRALGLPFSIRSFLIAFLSCTLPLFEEICKRTLS